MTECRRIKCPEDAWYFEVNLGDRWDDRLLSEGIGVLRTALILKRAVGLEVVL